MLAQLLVELGLRRHLLLVILAIHVVVLISDDFLVVEESERQSLTQILATDVVDDVTVFAVANAGDNEDLTFDALGELDGGDVVVGLLSISIGFVLHFIRVQICLTARRFIHTIYGQQRLSLFNYRELLLKICLLLELDNAEIEVNLVVVDECFVL